MTTASGISSERVLETHGLTAHYGSTQVLFGIDLTLHRGETVTIVGRNGAGRSTLLKSVAGRVSRKGDIRFNGRAIDALPAFKVAREGIAYVPENREIFPDLTVHQNLVLGQPATNNTSQGALSWSFERSYDMFPSLAARRDTPAGVLSGGEQQMLAFSRALMGAPSLLLVDEPTEGLSPIVVETISDAIRTLKASGLSILLVEQKLDIALEVSERVYVLGLGQVVFEGTPQALEADAEIIKTWIEV